MAAQTPVSTPAPTYKLKIPYVREDVHALLMWEDPKKSGLVLGGITFLFGVRYYTGLPFVSMVAYALALAVIFFGVWARFGKSIGQPLPEMPAVLREGVSEADWKRYADLAKPYVDKGIGYIYSLVVCKDVYFSAKVVAVAAAVGKVFSMVPFAAAYIVVVLAFSLPKLYENNQKEIEDFVGKAQVEANKVYSKVKNTVLKTINDNPTLAKLTGQKKA